MGFEAFNQTIKNMVKRSNYKSTTLSVAKFWSISTARALRRGRAGAWFEDSAVAASELSTAVSTMCTGSELMEAASDDQVVAAQQLHSFSRGSVNRSVNIKVGAWVHVQSAAAPDQSYICQISDGWRSYSRMMHGIFACWPASV